jgi:acetyl esterase/lipase
VKVLDKVRGDLMKSKWQWSLLVATVWASTAFAQEALPLYSGITPNSIEAPDGETLRDPKDAYPFYQNISRPKIYPYPLLEAKGPRAAIIILPGGSYRGVSIVKEGSDVAKQLNAYGIAAFVVKYRTPSDTHMRDRTIGPLQDAQQALRLVREKAREWNVDPKRVGLMGFSAGGHLASTVAVQFTRPVLSGVTPEQVRPDFLMLNYPVISFSDAITHVGSRETLLGSKPTEQQIKRYSNEQHVSGQTPPTFIMHAADDKAVPVANSIKFLEALQAAGVSSQLIVYPQGGHGFGLNNPTTPDRWIERLRDWLLSRGYLQSDECAGRPLASPTARVGKYI